MEYLMLIGGLILLIASGEALVRGAVGIALKLKISALVIGMTVVSFGTSAPELLVSIKAALEGHPDISIGAVIGSNISNIALVLGITVLIFPIVVQRATLTTDWPLMMGATILFYFFAFNSRLDRWEGLLFVGILTAFSAFIISKSRKEGKKAAEEEELVEEQKASSIGKNLAFILIGCLGLTFGADWLLQGVVIIAEDIGISQKLISVTVVAFGTSLPELITSAVAAFKRQTDISIGNLIGSNVFNLLAILGITSIITPIPISDAIRNLDMYFLLAISFLIFPMMLMGRKIGRLKGVFLLLFYAFYIYFVIAADLGG